MNLHTIIFDVTEADYKEKYQVYEVWINNARQQIKTDNLNTGCGCCVDIFEFECDDDIFKTFPPELLVDIAHEG